MPDKAALDAIVELRQSSTMERMASPSLSSIENIRTHSRRGREESTTPDDDDDDDDEDDDDDVDDDDDDSMRRLCSMMRSRSCPSRMRRCDATRITPGGEGRRCRSDDRYRMPPREEHRSDAVVGSIGVPT
jgi:hypothetical protein